MVDLDGLQNDISLAINKGEKLLGTSAGAAIGGAVVGAAVVGTTVLVASSLKSSSSRTSKRTRRKITHTKRGLKQDRKRFNKSQKWEVAYRKRKKSKSKSNKSRRGIRYTKNGQPYKIMANGRARFIKKTKRK